MWLGGASQGNAYKNTSAGNVVGNLFYGSEGYMAKDVHKWQSFMGQKMESGESGSGIGDHYANFAEAIRSADPKTFNTGIANGFNTCAVIHLGNISYRLGRSLEFDPVTMRFPHDDEANAMLTREYRAPFIVPDKV
jgi:hypothetical protein